MTSLYRGSTTFAVLSILLLLTGCIATLVVREDDEWLTDALSGSGINLWVRGNVSLAVLPDDTRALVPGETPSRGYVRWRLYYPEISLLHDTGNAWLERFLTRDEAMVPMRLVLRIEKLQYGEFREPSLKSYGWVRVLLNAALVDSVGAIIRQGAYDSGEVPSEWFSTGLMPAGYGDKYQEHYSRVVYKAILVALTRAMRDIAVWSPQYLQLLEGN